MKLIKFLVFLSACALLAGCSKSSTTNNANATVNTTSTMNVTASPKATVEPTKSPTETTNSQSKVSKPEDAAEGLFNAWKTKDRTAAAKFATSDAITSLYSEGGPEGLKFQGCDKQGESYRCSYYYEGGDLMMVVEGSDANGYKVTSTAFTAD